VEAAHLALAHEHRPAALPVCQRRPDGETEMA
jgi:hypothetical protein